MSILSTQRFTPNRFRCRKCKALLTSFPERLMSEWGIRCLSCGAVNLINYRIEIIGWRFDDYEKAKEENY